MKEFHLVCNAHIDPIWQWDIAEGVSTVLSTFYSAAKLAEEFNYVFCHNEVSIYKYVEEYAPELFSKIQELVKLGRWHIMGGWYLQPDCNMPSGESFVRQIREGERYFKEKFGVFPTTAINFDPFGHTRSLVQIIKKCGQDGYLFMRPHPSELKLPCEQFIWQSPDGSQIKAARTGPYNSPLGKSAETLRERANGRKLPVEILLWGVGNHGGGPSRKDLGDIERELISDKNDRFIHSTPAEFFAKVSPSDVFDKSLQISNPGCYTSMHKVKKLHAELERELFLAEKMAAVAYAKGALDDYPERELRDATEDLLNAEFHDVLPGSSVQSGEDEGVRLLNHGMLTAERAKLKAYFALAKTEAPAADGEYPIVIFNPHASEFTENIECEFMLADQNWSTDVESVITIKDKDGNVVPYQIIKEESNLNLDWRKRVIFTAKLEPLSLARYSAYVSFEPKKAKECKESFTFDDGRKHVEIDRSTGLLSSYKINGKEYLKDGFCLVSFDDNADPWAMGGDQRLRLGTNERRFVTSELPLGPFAGMKSVQVVEDGDIYLGIEAFFELDNTRARILYKIYKNNDDVDIDVTLYLSDINRIIKLKLPIAAEGELIGQTAYGTDELFMDGRENVAHRFVALDTGDECVALMNTGVYGGHYEDGALYTSLVRGVTYCAHPIQARELIPSDRYTKKIDQGENNYSFRLTVTDRESLECKTERFVTKPYSLNIFPIPTDTSEICDFKLIVGDSSLTVPTIKKRDGADEVVIRLLNNTPSDKDTFIEINGKRLPLSFVKYEVKTVIYKNGLLEECYEMII